MAEPREAFTEVGGVRLHSLEWAGGAPAVYCVPGITANAHAFHGLAAELAPRHRVVAVDLRGRGESDKPEQGYDVATHAADLAGVLDAHGVDCAVVVGWSLGAKVALAFAALHARRAERIVLVDPPLDTSEEALAFLRRFWARLDNTYASVDEFLERMRSSGVFKVWTPYHERYLRGDVARGPDGAVRHLVPRWVPEREIESEPRCPTRSFFGRVRCPVLLLRAPAPFAREGDQVLTAAQAREFADAVGARLVEVEGADHFSILLGKPPATLAAIQDFLAA